MKLPRLLTPQRAMWLGLVLCAMLATVFVLSRWVSLKVWKWSDTPGVPAAPAVQWYVKITAGRVELGENLSPLENFDRGAMSSSIEQNDEPRLRLWFHFAHVDLGYGMSWRSISCPLWIPFFLLAVPTAWLFRVDRRAKPWQCAKCRYDLRGLEGGVCPECGAEREA